MFNPQLLGGMGQLPDLPTQAELWKEEKSKFRPFIIMFGIGILIVFALLLASFILNVSTSGIKETIADKLLSSYRDNYDSNQAIAEAQAASDAKSWYTTYILAYPIVSFVLLGIGVALYAVSVYDSYTKKSFAKLSGYATAIVFVGAMFSVFQLISMAWSDFAKIEVQFPGGIFQVIAYALVIAIAFLGSQVSRIRRTFLASARVEALKSDPNFQAAQAQINQMLTGQIPTQTNGFGPIINQPLDPNAPAGTTAPQAIAPQFSKEQQKLEAMSIANLRKVAKKLSISGFDKMEKKELIEAVLRVTSKPEE